MCKTYPEGLKTFFFADFSVVVRTSCFSCSLDLQWALKVFFFFLITLRLKTMHHFLTSPVNRCLDVSFLGFGPTDRELMSCRKQQEDVTPHRAGAKSSFQRVYEHMFSAIIQQTLPVTPALRRTHNMLITSQVDMIHSILGLLFSLLGRGI